MNHYRPVTLAAVLCAALGLGVPGGAAAGTLFLPAASTAAKAGAPHTRHPDLIEIQKTGGSWNADPGTLNGHNQHYSGPTRKRRFYNPGVFLDGKRHGYDPYYHDPYHDPYYSAPSYGPARYSCREIRNMLRRQGYRHIEAHDCTGKVYTFVAYAGHKRYKLRIRSKNGSIKTRKRL